MADRIPNTQPPRQMAREAALLPSSYNEADRTIDIVWSTGARVRRESWFDDPWDEELLMSEGAVRLGRLNKGASLLDSHKSHGLVNVIGGVVPGSARLAPGAEFDLPEFPTVGVAKVRLSERPDLVGIVKDIISGIIRHVSIGYDTLKWDIVRGGGGDGFDLYRATDWEPHEVSFVPVAADPDAQSRSGEAIPPELLKLLREIRAALPASEPAPAVEPPPAPAPKSDPVPSPSAASRRRNRHKERAMKRAIQFPKAADLAIAKGDSLFWNEADGEVTKTATDKALGTAAEDAAAADEFCQVDLPEAVTPDVPAGDPMAADIEAERKKAATEAGAKAERSRQKSIQVRAANLPGIKPELVQELIDKGIDVETATSRLFAAAIERSDKTPTNPHAPAMPGDVDNRKERGEAMGRALLHRFDPKRHKLDAAARQYRTQSLVRLGEEFLRDNGVETRGMSPQEIAKRALSFRTSFNTTSDFVSILENVATKTLRDAYQDSPRTFQPFCRQVSLADFKTTNRVQLGEAPILELVNEAGEYKSGTMAESKESIRLKTYGKIIPITRQVIINDDLDAFTRVPAAFGDSAAATESDVVWGLITANVLLGDGVALFSAANSRKNLSGSAAAIAADKVTELRKLMRRQKGLSGSRPLNIIPEFILLPVALEGEWAKIAGPALTPATAANATPEFVRSMQPIVEPRLDDASETAYFLAAAPTRIDTIEYAYLAGDEGVVVETEDTFDTDGIKIKARLDFGAAAIDFRGFAKNAGA